MTRAILITGGAGFIGSHFVRYVLGDGLYDRVINVDLLTYCGNRANNQDVRGNPRYRFYRADIGDFQTMRRILQKEKPWAIVNFAAESDNNKAVSSPLDFARTNALGTAVLLEAARQTGVRRFHQISTCEVFGQLSLGSRRSFKESSPLSPRTPYNASKAAGDLIAESYWRTFGFSVTISRCGNNYGTHQFPEKVIPVFAIKAMRNEPLPVFKSSGNKREWIHVLDHCRAVDLILKKGKIGESYNVGTGLEKSIAELANDILKILNKPDSLRKIIPDRLGHDTRYLLNSSKLRKLGWKPQVNWAEGLRETVVWYQANSQWWRPLLKKSHSWK